MSVRLEILTVALAMTVLAGFSGWTVWATAESDASLWWFAALVVVWVLLLGVSALAWAGWGRWLFDQADASARSRRWWRLWFVPWAFWVVNSVARDAVDGLNELIHGSGEGLSLVLLVPPSVVGIAASLAGFVLVLAFAFREIDHLSRKRRAAR
ncbi:hypothetical protein [Candidatus Palauibacter sp.]|uniref:hypothetical protein n=1 Tax=Candidatus Palauibacter sp. TaxID=3101350 RepID=UPI003B529B8A